MSELSPEQHYGKVYHMYCVNHACRFQFDLEPDGVTRLICPKCRFPAIVSSASDKALVPS